MIKTLIIDNKEVPFASSGAFLIRYKSQFQKDALQTMLKVSNALQEAFKGIDLEDEEQKKEAIKKHMDVFIESNITTLAYELIWTLAKTADRTIPDLETWLDKFEEFDIFYVFGEVQELLTKSFKTSVKK